MSETESFSFFPAAYRGRQLKPTIILLTSLLLSLIWWYFGRFRFYDKHLAARFVLWDDVETTGALYTFVNCFILLGVIPALIVKRVFHENLADYGVQFGDWRRTVRSFLMFAPLFVLAAYIGSRKPDVVDFYPINKNAGDSPTMFGFHAVTYLLLYMGFEFHYRGFIQFGLKDSIGQINALLVQVTTSTMIHLDPSKPANETFGSIFCGFLWGTIAFRSQSLLSGMLQHFLLGLSLDYFICFNS